MIRKGMIEKIYASASMQRWIDHIRPIEFTEIDKQAHKMTIAYVIAKYEELEKNRKEVDWLKLIEGGLFELLERVVLTDIKPSIFTKIKKKHGHVLNKLVLENVSDAIEGTEGFRKRFETYLADPEEGAFEKRILKAAHDLSTYWEFRTIYGLNKHLYGIEATRARIESEIERHLDLPGVRKIMACEKSSGFIDLCGQLRFQQRWAQTQRIPKTSVLGHLLIVAILSYLCSLEFGACRERL
jgi:putative hydrolase of HD superfamily